MQGCCGPLALLIRQPKMALYLPYFSHWPYYIFLIFSFRSQYQLPLPYFMAAGLIFESTLLTVNIQQKKIWTVAIFSSDLWPYLP